MPYDVRMLAQADATAAWDLGSTAFGYRDESMPGNWSPTGAGRSSWGVFDGSGRLLAKATDREQGQWFGGRIVPTSGIAGVVVAPESRGTGLARIVLTRLLAHAHERGAAISTLYCTTPLPYRRLGWEEVGALTDIAVPTTALSGLRAPKEVVLRPATVDDVPAIYELYRDMARSGAGLMERAGPHFTASPAELIGAFHGVTVACGEGGVTGYATWNRGPGYDASGVLTVYDLVGSDQAAIAALMAMLGTWASVAPTVTLRLPDGDPAYLFFSSVTATVRSRRPWMLRVLDLPAAVAARGWPAHLDAAVDLDLIDEVCPWQAGAHRLVLAGGQARVEPGGRGEVRLTERGLGLLYAGAAGTAVLRRAGLLSGGDGRTDATLDAAFAAPRPALLDYF